MLDFKKEIDQWGPIEAKLLYMTFWFDAISFAAARRFNAVWPECIGIFEKYRITYIWEREEMLRKGKEAIENVLNDSNEWDRVWQSYLDVKRRLSKLVKKIEKISASENQRFEDVGVLAVQFGKLLKETWVVGVVPELVNFGSPAYLEGQLKAYVSLREMPSALEALLAPEDLSFHQKSEQELLRIVESFGPRASASHFESYARRWHWVENSYFESKRLTADYFKKQVSGLTKDEAVRKLREIADSLTGRMKRKAEVIRKYHMPKEVARLSKDLAFSIWWQDDRKGLAWWANRIIDDLSAVAEKHFDVSHEDLMMYRAEEWTALFQSGQKAPQDVLESRVQLSVFDCKDTGVEEIRGAKAESIKEAWPGREQARPSHGVVTELRGVPVSPGKATGKVRVLHSARNADTMEEGEVLVAPMTSPEYIIAMRKSSAIIADIGGLMSHAAIVSRELKKPCVVGTKVATKVLRDGDLVEVDAERGVVKIIKRAVEKTR